MSFSDPQSVTINAVAQSLPRVSLGSYTSTYQKDDRTVILKVAHQYTGKKKDRIRTAVRLDQVKIAADPLLVTVNNTYQASVSLIIDRPTAGFSAAEIKYIVDALLGNLQATSGANIVKAIAMES